MGFCGKLDRLLGLRLRQVLAVIFGTVEMLFFGGIIFGFNVLTPVLQKEGVFSYLCRESENKTVGCSEQTTMPPYCEISSLFIVTYRLSDMSALLSERSTSFSETNKSGPRELGDDEEIKSDSPEKLLTQDEQISGITRCQYPTVLASLRSLPFILITCFFSFAMRLAQVLSFSLAGGIFAGMACGSTIDYLRSRLQPFLIKCLALGANNALLCTISSFIMTAFPIEQFGTLYGISGSLAGAFSCIQYAQLSLPVITANVISCFFVPLMGAVPVTILVKGIKSWNKRQETA
ncbi:hypothetical protein TcWFU_003733 [Taenia crassiceps]|uniref:Uncharacterized protein n=1 Tax=Taenia crassiceps TaxID=6207 RepID=A0ABR4QQC0_9CEST